MRASASLLLVSALAGGWAWAGGNRATASANTSVSIIRPIALRNIQDLYFGALLVEAGAAGGPIRQHAAYGGGTREADPAGIVQVALSTDHWHNAEFEIRGEPGANFSVCMPKGSIVIHAASARAASLPVVRLNYYTDNAIDTQGSTRMWVGGTLQLPARPSPGHYHALFPVTVAYY